MVTLPEISISKVSLGYLASYDTMGWAQLECLGACSCHRMMIDANSTARVSQEHFATINIESQNEGNGCLLKVSNLNHSSSAGNGHKFKVSSVAWSGENQSAGDTLQSNQQDVPNLIDDRNTRIASSRSSAAAASKPEPRVTIGSIYERYIQMRSRSTQ